MQVCITGIGVISGIGKDVAENLASLQAGRHGMGPVSLFPTRHAVPVGEVKADNEQLAACLGLQAGLYSRTALLGMTAAREACADAGLDDDAKQALRIGLISSTSVGGMDLTEQFYPAFRRNTGKGRLRYVATHDCGDSTERMARWLGIRDYVTTVSTACSSAANAIIFGARLIRAGYLDCVIAGGTDALCRFTLNGFSSLMILDREHCRPFDASRAGLNLGEGAGYVVMQSEASVRRPPYCLLAGYANANDAFHQTASSPEGDGPYLAMKQALQRSGLQAADIQYINVHGTGTPNNDLSEGIALQRLFGPGVPPFSSTKAFTGHTLGAAGGIEAVYSVLAVRRGILFPCLNFREPMPETGLVPNTTWQAGLPLRAVLSNSFGFGGNNASLIFASLH